MSKIGFASEAIGRFLVGYAITNAVYYVLLHNEYHLTSGLGVGVGVGAGWALMEWRKRRKK